MSLRSRHRELADVGGGVGIFGRELLDIAELDVFVPDDHARPFGAGAQEPATVAGDARGVKRVAGDEELEELPADDVRSDDDELAIAVLA